MKQNLLKSIAMTVAMVAFCVTTTQAQEIDIDSIMQKNAVKYATIFAQKPDSVITVQGYEIFFRDGKIVVSNKKLEPVVVVSPAKEDEVIANLDTLSIERTLDYMVRKDQRYDVKFYSYQDSTGTRIVPSKNVRKDGLFGGVRVGYMWGRGYQSPTAFADLSWVNPWWGATVSVGIGKAVNSSAAVEANKEYFCMRAEGVLSVQPFKLDAFDQHRLSVFGGIGFRYMETDSQPYQGEDGETYYVKSGGNILYPTAGLEYKFRPFAWGHHFVMRAQWGLDKYVIQNQKSTYSSFWAVSLGFHF